MKRVAISLAAAGALLALAGVARAAEKDPFGSLTVDQVADLIAKKEVSVYDNNELDRYKQSHLPTAKWVDFKKVTAADLPQDKDRTLVFYCANEK
jgi:rhodanese-related sulfurtransferase